MTTETTISDGIADETVLTGDISHQQGKRHFPHINNRTSSLQSKTTVRRFMPHGSGEDYDIYQSRMRYLVTSDEKSMAYCPLLILDTSQEHKKQQEYQHDLSEVLISSGGVDGSLEEINFPIPKYLSDRRNNFPLSTPGDKSYHAVEYSPDFFKIGATVPAVNFGYDSKKGPEMSNIQLCTITGKRKTFAELESERQKELEVAEVARLDEWRPASPLVNPGFSVPIAAMSSPSRRRKV